MTGYSAKNMASSVFVAERKIEFTDHTDNNFAPVNLADDVVDPKEDIARASLFGLKERTAVYREGLGSVLIPEGIDYKPLGIKPKRQTTQRRLPFPYGHLDQKAKEFPNVDYDKLTMLVSKYTDAATKTRAFLIVYKDQIIAETYADGFDKNSKLLGWSMTKSITGTLYGICLLYTSPSPRD